MKTVSQMNERMRSIACAVLAAAVSTAATGALADEGADALLSGVDFGVSAAWDSRYVSEGRDNLDGDGLVGTTVEAAYEGLSLSVYYASSPNVDYREVNVGASYTLEWNDWEASVSYTFLRFLNDKENDNEVGLGLSYSGLPGGFAVGVDGCYSFEAEGAFIETFIERECEVADWLALTPSAVVGWNADYVVDGHNGANHVALALEADVPLKAGLELTGNVAYTWAIDEDADAHCEDEGLRNMFYGGVAVNASF
ncbi:MAG: hypothetical protein ACOX9C_12490 [Kiritimatiellia bacterium]|jgi:hypothetical protein